MPSVLVLGGPEGLPDGNAPDYRVVFMCVIAAYGFTRRKVFDSALSRLIGYRLRLRRQDNRLDAHIGGARLATAARAGAHEPCLLRTGPSLAARTIHQHYRRKRACRDLAI